MKPGVRNPRPTRVGVMGAGWVAKERHIPCYKRLPLVEVVAIYDPDSSRAESAARQKGISSPFSDADAFLDQDLDVVSICTPPWTHTELAVSALTRGAHVFTEKPMALCAQDAATMVQAAEDNGKLLCVSHNFLFSRSVMRASRVLEEIGPVSHALGLQLSSTSRRLPAWYERLPGGLLSDESPHLLYTLQHFLGPLELQGAHAAFDERSGLPLSAQLFLRGNTGSAQVTMLFESPLSEWHVGLLAKRGGVVLDLFRDIAITLGEDAEHKPHQVLNTSLTALLGHARGVVTSGSLFMTRRLFWGHDALIRAFIDAVRSGEPSPVPPRDSLSIVSLTDAILAELGLDSHRTTS